MIILASIREFGLQSILRFFHLLYLFLLYCSCIWESDVKN